jgi:YggT family protein
MAALICTLLQLFVVVLLLRIVLSWFPPGGSVLESVRRFTEVATEWLLGPLRRVLPPVRLGAAALDLSPLVALIGVQVLAGILCR